MTKILKGRLLLAPRPDKQQLPPYNTMLIVDTLIKTNKPFDLVVFPQGLPAYGIDTPYMTCREDYCIRHLASLEPLLDYQFPRQTRATGCSKKMRGKWPLLECPLGEEKRHRLTSQLFVQINSELSCHRFSDRV